MQIALKEKILILALTFSALFLGMTLFSTTTHAQEEGEQEQTVEVVEEQPAEEQNNEEPAVTNYTFTAQQGDSYSKIARKSIQIYGIDNQVDLSEAQIMFIETNLTQDAGSPYLDIGQEVQIGSDKIAAYVDQASNLTESELAAWQYYADMADFNTDNVGEVR